MGDFFYYGQKDTIQRLNELAGRGAVVASYAPAVGLSPLGGSNGYMNPAWIDPAIPIRSDKPLGAGGTAKYGYDYLQNGGGARCLLVAQILVGTYASLRISGVQTFFSGGVWHSTEVNIVIHGQDGLKVEWHANGRRSEQTSFLVTLLGDGAYNIYAYLGPGAYCRCSFDLLGSGATTFSSPVETSAVTGTLVFNTAQTVGAAGYVAPRWYDFPSPGAGTLFNKAVGAGDGSITTTFLSAGALQNELAPGASKEILRLGVGGIDSLAHPGCFGFLASAGTGSLQKEGFRLAVKAYDTGSNVWSADLLSIKGDGAVYMPLLKAGSSDASTLRHNISRGTAQGNEILHVGRGGATNPCVAVLVSDGLGGWNAASSVLYAGKNSATGRSVSVPGTVNTMGNDYAEYIFKCPTCGIVAPGQIVGITADNKVTDQWADAVMFSIKSTAPSFVGGDSWASDIGSRPSPQAGPAPTESLRRADVVTQQPVPGINPPEYEDVVTESGDTDDEWAEKQATFTAALAAHELAVQQDVETMATFDAALEAARQKVDRIAIAGRVPVNVLGAQPGDYIVPVQDGAGIKGIAVHEDDLSMKQYLHAVGRVISIDPDGRAYVMVKAV